MTITGYAPGAPVWFWVGPTVFSPPGGDDSTYDYVVWFTGLEPGVVATEATTWSHGQGAVRVTERLTWNADERSRSHAQSPCRSSSLPGARRRRPPRTSATRRRPRHPRPTPRTSPTRSARAATPSPPRRSFPPFPTTTPAPPSATSTTTTRSAPYAGATRPTSSTSTSPRRARAPQHRPLRLRPTTPGLYVYDAGLNLIACNDDFYFGDLAACTSRQLENVTLTPAPTYYIIVDGYGAASGAYVLDVEALRCVCPAILPGRRPAGRRTAAGRRLRRQLRTAAATRPGLPVPEPSRGDATATRSCAA